MINLSVQELLRRINQAYRTTKQRKFQKDTFFLNQRSNFILFFLNTITVNDDLLGCLYTLLPIHSIPALDLCDHQSITLISSPSGRNIYSCLRSTGTPYLISYSGILCSCPSYRNNLSYEHPWCKHLLALQLSIAMGTVQQRHVTEESLLGMLSELMLTGED